MRAALITLITCFLLLPGCFAPKKWPIPQLTVPPGAPPARIPDAMLDAEFKKHMSPDGSHLIEGFNVYSWMNGFNYAQGWDSLVRHVEGAIKPLGYTPFTGSVFQQIPSIPGVPDGTIARGWKSPDGKYLVAAINVAFLKSRGATNVSSSDADYVLMIDQVKDLPPQLQEKVDAAGGV